jgi:hypothetical protein
MSKTVVPHGPRQSHCIAFAGWIYFAGNIIYHTALISRYWQSYTAGRVHAAITHKSIFKLHQSSQGITYEHFLEICVCIATQ